LIGDSAASGGGDGFRFVQSAVAVGVARYRYRAAIRTCPCRGLGAQRAIPVLLRHRLRATAIVVERHCIGQFSIERAVAVEVALSRRRQAGRAGRRGRLIAQRVVGVLVLHGAVPKVVGIW